ncbi:helix-turn-helix transcriptional regulator [Olsenella sp. An293]|uniref:helix-turn-helix domain-containing protein n=1 Tax=Olsenella sp. An293 TaxID=1965626 RepID=UPI000B36C05D|nr:helix-turn-helix transcriptional regulator [Olsenella sp. An293]OUO32639.1 transcriptional regulator [Olsenella sp. An293]
MKRPIPMRTMLAAQQIGENLATWRKMLGLTAEQVAVKAAVSRSTLSRIENADPTVSFATFLNVCRTLGILDLVTEATDPYETEIGRIRADRALPQRVRRRS